MEKSLVKLYLFIVAIAALIIVLAPAALGHMSSWVEDTWTHVQLAAAGDIQAVPQADSAKGRVVFVMDDGWETQYTTGRPLFDEYGYPACVAVIPAAVGTDRYMTYRQLADLYLDGWDMLNHTYNHIELTGLTEEGQEGQISRGRDWLENHGFDRGADMLVFPGGVFDKVTLEVMKKTGTSAGRSLKSLWAAKTDCTLEDVEICNLISGMDMKTTKAAVDKAMNNKSTIIFMMHKIEPVTDDTYMQINETFLDCLLRYISENGDKLDVMTMTQLLDEEQAR